MKHTNKPNPLKVFNDNNAAAYKKAGGAMKEFKKSLKKAQDGIEMNDDMINKPGSTGGYKKPLEKYKPWEGPVKLINPADEKRPNYMEPTREYADPRMNPYYNSKPDTKKYEGPKALSARMAAMKQKKGGSVKRKK